VFPDYLTIPDWYYMRVRVANIHQEDALWGRLSIPKEPSIGYQSGSCTSMSTSIFCRVGSESLTGGSEIALKLPFLEDHLVVRLCYVR
jgi:hypothetical protein